MIRVLLADHEGAARSALAALLEPEPDLEVVAQAADGAAAVTAALAHRPDVAVVDLRTPGLDGLQVAAELARTLPACAVVVLTPHGRPSHLHRALAAGARGCVPKGSPGGVLADVVRRVHGGGRYVDPDLAADALTAPPCPLTPRELDVLRLTAGGAPVAEIARRARLSPGTVRNRLASAARKLGAATRAEAVALARDRDWL